MQDSGTYELSMILGAATLLLWGVRMARTGVMRVWGAEIRRNLPRALKNPIVALLAGVGSATLLQSSIAVALFTSSLASVGAVPLAKGLLVLLGADAGSAVVAALLTLNIKAFWPLLMFAGYLLHAIYSETGSPFKQLGRILLGMAMILIALTFMSQVSSSLASSELIRIVISSLGDEPFLTLLLFAILTWLAHSSIAILLFWASLVHAGITVDPALIVTAVLGINLGNAAPPIVMTWNQAAPGRRIVLGNAIFKIVGVLVCFALLGFVQRVFDLLPGEAVFRVVLLHILFNLCLVLVFAGTVDPVARLLEKLFSSPAAAIDELRPKYIPGVSGDIDKPEPFPVLALSREVLRILGTIQNMLEATLFMLLSGTSEKAQEVSRMEEKVNVLFKAVRAYAVELTRKEIAEADQRKIIALLRYTASLENAGDVIHRATTAIPPASRKEDYFSEAGRQELDALFRFLIGNAQFAAEAIMTWRQDSAGVLVQRKRDFKKMCRASSKEHIGRLSQGVSNALASSSAHLDLLSDLAWISTQIASIGYDVLPATENSGDEAAEKLTTLPE